MPESEILEHYKKLGIAYGAAVPEVRKSARALFMQLHPDLNPGDREKEDRLKDILNSYRIIMDAIRCGGQSAITRAAGDDQMRGIEGRDFPVVVFIVSNRRFAFPMEDVKEIVRLGDIRVEDAEMISEKQPFISGVFRRSGRTAALWNLHRQFRFREMPIGSDISDSSVIISEIDDSLIGFVVDSMEGIENMAFEQDEQPPGTGGLEELFIEGGINGDSGFTGLINLKTIIYNYD